ncbi:probable replication factor A 73 kDa subunit [Papaver somniferum]|uniref:probable replication factor A 73 kDa subunit n=1 Tax=Papaver somniferum TaxID=3469 RepID=UPI000E6F883E|nr:probable replication factor A 73 kDa subunit [Papaver somniferum]XP_026394052.1 probable replication factor A 73 kDa subunit [Papaver somniferum]
MREITIENLRGTTMKIAIWGSAANQAANVLICNATTTHVLIENGWHYLTCHRCSKKVMGDDGDLRCTKCEAKVEMPIARFMVRFEVEDHTGTTVFVALDSEVQKLVRSTATELTRSVRG